MSVRLDDPLLNPSLVVRDGAILAPSLVVQSEAGSIFDSAAGAWRASDYHEGSSYLVDRSPSQLAMRLGSVGKSEIVAGPHGSWLQLPGTAGHYAHTPHHTDLDITGDLDLRAKVALVDWSPSTAPVLVGKWVTTSNQRSYFLGVTSGGSLQLAWSPDGTSTNQKVESSSVSTGFADGAVKWVRATLDVDNGSAAYEVKFYTSDDGVTWEQLGLTRTGASTTSVHVGTAGLEVGSVVNGVANNLVGRIYRAIVKSGIDGTTVLDADFTGLRAGASFFRESTGKVVQIAQSNARINGGLWLGGLTGNYARVANRGVLNITGDIDLRAKVLMADWTPGATVAVVGKYISSGSIDSSYLMRILTNGVLNLLWRDGSVQHSVDSTEAVGAVDGTAKWVRATLDVDDGAGNHVVRFYTSDDGVTWTQLGATITLAGTTVIQTGGAALTVGAFNEGANAPFIGRIDWVQVRDGIDGTVVFERDFTTLAPVGRRRYTSEDANAHNIWIVFTDPGADTNDPKFLAYSSTQYLYQPGVVGNYINRTYNGYASKSTGSVDFRIRVRLPDYTPSGNVPVMGCNSTLMYLRVQTTGVLQMSLHDGSVHVPANSTESLPVAGDTDVWLRGVYDLDADEVTFYYSEDSTNDHTAVTWTQLGNVVSVTFGTTASNINGLHVSADTAGGPGAEGRYYAAAFLNDGVVVGAPNFTDQSEWAEPFSRATDGDGFSWTAVRPSSGRKLAFVDRPMFLLGTDDYFEIPDHDDLDFGASDAFSVVVALRAYGTPSITNAYVVKRTNTGATNAGWAVYRSGSSADGSFEIADGSVMTTESEGFLTAGEAGVLAAVRDVVADELRLHVDGVSAAATTDGTTATLTNTEAVTIGRWGSAGARYADVEFLGAAIHRYKLTAEEMSRGSNELRSAS